MHALLRTLFVVGLATVVAGDRTSGAVQPAGGGLTIEHLIDIRHPSSPLWSPDGRRLAFLWDRAGITALWVSDAADPGRPRALVEDGRGVGNVFWSPDSARVYFSRGGDLWQVPASGGDPQPVWTSPAPESNITPSSDATRVAFLRPAANATDERPSSDLWIRSLADGRESKLTTNMGGVGGLSWSPDGRRLSFSLGQSIRHADAPSYSGAKILYTYVERSPGDIYVIAADGGAPVAMAQSPEPELGGRWLDADHVIVERQTRYKRREILVVNAATGQARTASDEEDPKFLSMPGGAGGFAQASPDGKWIAVLSDRDGWDHLYVVPAAGGPAIQITRGSFEAWRPAWSPDSTRIAFDTNEGDNPGRRQLRVATLGADPARASIVTITSGRGTNVAPEWSPDGRSLVYQHTDPRNPADLFLVRAEAGAKPQRVSESMPAGIDRSAFVEPELVHYPGPDGQKVPAYLFVPSGLDRSRRHPAIVWIHGDGINQNYDGWHVQRNYAVYYSFHQYLLQRGYVVIAPDYRGSIGYGRAWRQGVHLDVGGQDARDAYIAGDYLKTLPYVDADRMGVWGLSYGGFFTLIAMVDQPRLFRCGVNVAGVADYEQYYNDPYHGGWTVSRIGTPEENPKVYEQASPLLRIGRLERPLLTLHGTADVNVPFLQSVRLMDEIFRKKKGHLADFMIYPGEFHYFTREHVLRDAWQRVDRFFEAHLRPAGRAQSDAGGMR